MYVQALHVHVVFFYMYPGTWLSKTTGQLLILTLVCVLGKAKNTYNVACYHHRTKYQESVNGNVAEICETVAET